MNKFIATTLIAAGTAALLCGCNKTETSKPAGDSAASPAPPSAPPAATATNTPEPAQLVESTKAAAPDLAAKFVDQTKTAADTQLGPIATELTDKMQALTTAVGTNSAIADKLTGTLQSFLGGEDSGALASAFQVAETAKLTPQQLGLAKEVGNLASAFVVQKNFAALEGAQGDVATLVNSLRSGSLTAAVAPLKNIATNAHLTDSQKQLITSIADKYAPGWQKAGQMLDSIKKLPGL